MCVLPYKGNKAPSDLTTDDLAVVRQETRNAILESAKLGSDESFSLLGKPLPWVEAYMYLGVVVSDTVSWEPALAGRFQGFSAAVRATEGLATFWRMPVSNRLKVMKQLVLPCALYGCEVWPTSGCKKQWIRMESAWCQALRACIGRNLKGAPKAAVMAELGEMDLLSYAWLQRLRFYAHVYRMSKERFPSAVFQTCLDTVRKTRSFNTILGGRDSNLMPNTWRLRMEEFLNSHLEIRDRPEMLQGGGVQAGGVDGGNADGEALQGVEIWVLRRTQGMGLMVIRSVPCG